MNLTHIPRSCGVYIFSDAAGSILYIGKAKDLSRRIAHYFSPDRVDAKTAALGPLVRAIDYIPCLSEREALLLERRLISRHQPYFNVSWKDSKSYPYVKITLGEDFPRLHLTRRRTADGGLYFGPFPKVSIVRGLLRTLRRRKLFPLRPCRWEFNRAKPLDPRKISSCLYFHTKECPAPCAGKITYSDYRRIAARAALFFGGGAARLETRLRRDMAAASRRLQYERAAELRDNVSALKHMAERVRVRAIKRDDLAGSLAATRGVSDLMSALGLKRPPFHIECFDISHFSGRQTVAGMVCFQGGVPFKDHYRRFRIRTIAGIDDFQAMAEVVGRRLGRLIRENAELPDLILVDGGAGQLGAALKAMEALRRQVPAAALAKRLEEVYRPGSGAPLRLEPHRPALRLLQHLRDEAHRFSVGYHRLLRGKRLLKNGP